MKKLILSLALSATATITQAGEFSQNPKDIDDSNKDNVIFSQENKNPDYSAFIMLGLASTPDYLGAKKQSISPVILPKFYFKPNEKQKIYSSLDEGLGYSYLLDNNLELGGGLSFRHGRNSSDADILTGLDSVSNTLTYTGFAKYTINNNYRLGLQIAKGFDSSNKGITSEVFAGYSKMITPKTGLDFFLSTHYGNKAFMQQNFSVSNADATSFRAAHSADAGLYKAGLRVALNRHIKGPHSVTLISKYTKLLGDAKDSTIVEKDNHLSFAAGYTYKF